ncbi:hypothetical protein [Neisseria sp. CCUG12390]|uniref:hypothetical protein n=1 Tax=Neisseria sp. CCUG12390 TaxID=3392035 RepID=UPI003A0FE4B7
MKIKAILEYLRENSDNRHLNGNTVGKAVWLLGKPALRISGFIEKILAYGGNRL